MALGNEGRNLCRQSLPMSLSEGIRSANCRAGTYPRESFSIFFSWEENKQKKKPKYLHSPEGLGELGRVPSPYLATQSQKTFPLPKCLGNRPARQHSPSSPLGGCRDRRDVGTEGRTGRPDSPSRGPRARSAARRVFLMPTPGCARRFKGLWYSYLPRFCVGFCFCFCFLVLIE